MSVVTYKNIRDEAIRQIVDALKNNKSIKVAAHPGRFSESEVRRLAQQTPAVLTSLVAVKDGDNDTQCNFVTWVLYRASNMDKLYDGALELVSFLMPVIRRMDAPWAYDVTDVAVDNLFTGSLDSINVTLWAIAWTWHVRGTSLAETEGGIVLPDDLEIFAGTDSIMKVETQSVKDKTDMEV